MLPPLHTQEARYDIASWINTLYKHKEVQAEINQQVQYETCVKTHRVRILPSTHYAKGKSITALGELMRVSTCKPVNVTVTEGRKDPCYINHITLQQGNVTKVMLPGSRVVFDIIDLKPVSCYNHPVFMYIGKDTYIGNKGQGMESLTVRKSVDHIKTHIFWSPIDSAIQDLTIMGEKTEHNNQVSYLNQLSGTPSIVQDTAEQVQGLTEVLDWSFGSGFTKKFATYMWSIVLVIIITSLCVFLVGIFLKLLCKRMWDFKCWPKKIVGVQSKEIEME